MKLNLFNLTLLVNFSLKFPKNQTDNTNDVPAMLLQSETERVSEMIFPVNWRPKFRNGELSKQ